jgi:hypothetical protein
MINVIMLWFEERAFSGGIELVLCYGNTTISFNLFIRCFVQVGGYFQLVSRYLRVFFFFFFFFELSSKKGEG